MTKDTTSSGVREAVARIIDPDEWLSLDREKITLRGRIRTISDAIKERRCKRSLAKADAILALVGGGAGEGWREELSAWCEARCEEQVKRAYDPELSETLQLAATGAAAALADVMGRIEEMSAPPVHVGGDQPEETKP